MTQDDIVEMAKQAGFLYGEMGFPGVPFVTAIGRTFIVELEAFAKLVAELEREECAKICDELDSNSYPYVVVFPNKCAEAIRARQ
jgi:hypothetical protein